MDHEAQEVIDKAIEKHGGKNYNDLHIRFSFRGKDYTIRLDNGNFEYKRIFQDSTSNYSDKLNNNGFTRNVNGKMLDLSEKDSRRFSNSVNSVAYFTLLPKGLNDEAVRKELLGEIKIHDKSYYIIKVSFKEEGGGDDHDDEFRYWINKESFTVDYLAYSYHVNGGGVRFREAIDPIEVAGVRFQNYINYKPESKKTPLDDLPVLFESGGLKKLSEIINENIQPNNMIK